MSLNERRDTFNLYKITCNLLNHIVFDKVLLATSSSAADDCMKDNKKRTDDVENILQK